VVNIVREESGSVLRLKLRRPDPATSARLATLLGTDLPGPNKLAIADALRVAWIGPGDWLLTGSDNRYAAIEEAIAGATGLVREVGDGYARYRLSGPGAVGVLQQGTSIDLRPDNFVPGSCAVTLFAQLHAAIELLGEALFIITVDVSCARYLENWFAQAMTGE
jgi:heterotetrameric sarcosine oxidase gamma subunit